MGKIVSKLLIFLSVLLIVLALFTSFDLFVIGNQYKNNYLASLNDKVERLSSIKEPKIILIGHSNLAFGMNSEMLEEETGMPVVNLGFYGSLGNAFHEEIAKKYIKKGDLVVVCHGSYDDDGGVGNAEAACIALSKNPKLYYIVNKRFMFDIIKAYPTYAQKSFISYALSLSDKKQDAPYSRTSFNKYGDVVDKPDSQKVATENLFFDGAVLVPEIGDECVERLNKLNDYCKKRGASLVVAGKPIGDSKYTPDKSEYIEFQNELASRLDCDVISDFTDYFIPCEYFYDTVNHLTEEGAEIRTKQLISDINGYLNK